jgi:hypothetical protein
MTKHPDVSIGVLGGAPIKIRASNDIFSQVNVTGDDANSGESKVQCIHMDERILCTIQEPGPDFCSTHYDEKKNTNPLINAMSQ